MANTNIDLIIEASGLDQAESDVRLTNQVRLSGTQYSWSSICQLPDFIEDETWLRTKFSKSIANETMMNQDTALLRAIVRLVAISRWFTKHLPDTKDIDLTPFIESTVKEVGLKLPLTAQLPLVEWVRESKSWNEHKGTEALIHFIGDLVNSPIEIDYPKDLIMRFDDPNVVLDGAEGVSGILSWKPSKLGRYQDGTFWWPFVYIVRVLQAQRVTSVADLFKLLDSVHPAGLKRAMIWQDNYSALAFTETTIGASFDIIYDFFIYHPYYPTLDNGLIFDDPGSLFDYGGSDDSLLTINFVQIAPIQTHVEFMRISSNTSYNQVDPVGKKSIQVSGPFSPGDQVSLVSYSPNFNKGAYPINSTWLNSQTMLSSYRTRLKPIMENLAYGTITSTYEAANVTGTLETGLIRGAAPFRSTWLGPRVGSYSPTSLLYSKQIIPNSSTPLNTSIKDWIWGISTTVNFVRPPDLNSVTNGLISAINVHFDLTGAFAVRSADTIELTYPSKKRITFSTNSTGMETFLVSDSSDNSQPWASFSRFVDQKAVLSITNESHIFRFVQPGSQRTTLKKSNITSIPVVDNSTQVITYVAGVDFSFDSKNSQITWITLPAEGDIILVDYQYRATIATEVFADDDDLVYENVTTNVGIGFYQLNTIMDLTWREIQSAAWNLNQQNMDGAWLQELVFFDSFEAKPM